MSEEKTSLLAGDAAKTISVIVNFCEADAEYLPRCIASLQWQMAERDQLIVVCDTNKTTMDSWQQKAFDLTAAAGGTHAHSDGGISKARNAGAWVASGKWLKFIDVDDVLAPFALQVFRQKNIPPSVKCIRGGQTTMINGQFSLDWIPAQVTGCDTKNRVMWLALWTSMNQINPALVSHTFIEREAFNAVAGFDEKLDWEEDWDLWLRMREKFGAEAFAGMRERVCYYWIDEAERAKKKRRHEVTIEDGTEIDVHEYLRRRHPGVDPAK